MSLITRCPACGTMFKVVPDQLRISEGWVRCGHCSEVFDATGHMQGESALTTEPGALGLQADPQVMPHAQAAAPAQPDSMHESEVFASSLTTDMGESTPSDIPIDSVQLREEAQAMVEGPLDRPFVLQLVADQPDPLPVPRTASRATQHPELHDLSFVRHARRKAFWSRPAIRGGLVLLALLLGVLFAVQVAHHERDRLFAGEPVLRPWLFQMCELLECTIGSPRQIESIVIDGSSFNKLRPDTYRLNLTLRNVAAMELAMPAIELTLTDAQDQPVIRRVLTPADLHSQGLLPARGEWSVMVALAVAGNGASSRIAGYRLLAFYP